MAQQRAIERFWEKTVKVDEPNGCWLWTGCKHEFGYGQFSAARRRVYAHRWIYERFIGPIPAGTELHHRCETPHCVNPNHLTPLTRAEHIDVSPNSAKNRTHCPQGHAYDEANTYRKPNGGRVCRICKVESKRRFDERRKARMDVAA